MRYLLALGMALTLCGSAAAQNKGFQINRYEPTPAGEWSFMVDHPWYSSTRWFAGGITLNYGHDPVVAGQFDGSSFNKVTPVIEHQLLGHVDLAGSFLDRVTIHASLPITFYESGNSVNGVSPLSGVGVGDLRLGAMVRLWRHADRDPVSLHLGIAFWAPFGLDNHQGDDGLRVMPKLVAAGYAHHIRWSADFAFYYRPESVIGNAAASRGNNIGSEVQIGAQVAYWNKENNFSVGPEALLSTVVTGGNGFGRDYTSLEVLLGGHYHIVKQVLLGVAVGTGILREPGTPDARVLFRAAYAPVRKEKPKDSDHDGILDPQDRCPLEPEDLDKFEDEDGCPDPDNDHDGILDVNDKCPNEPEDKDGFEDQDGCPDPDNDKDGILDQDDKCPNEAGPKENLGCPDKDRDGDTVVDRLDNCPDEPGDPANQGCKKKQLAQLRGGRIDIIDSVYFATNKDVILARSFPLLVNVADVINSHPDIAKVLVEGHTDDRGKLDHNMDLSARRARSVVRFLTMHGVAEARLEARGFGPTQPIADNKTEAGRSRNRRVVFTIVGSAGNIETRESGPATPSSDDQRK